MWCRSMGFVLLSAAMAAAQVPPLPLAGADQADAWSGGAVDRDHARGGQAAVGWNHGQSAGLRLTQVPADWRPYNQLSFWAWSAKATGSRFMLLIYSQNPATEGDDYYSAGITIGWEGWKQFRFYLPSLGVNREPVGWSQIGALNLSASGWGNQPDPEAYLALAEFRLEWVEPPKGPTMSEDELFGALNLQLPALAEVKAAEAAGDRAAARAALCRYYRQRATPRAFTLPGARSDPKPAEPNTERADRVLRHELESIGIRHQFGPVIDWHFDKTAEKGANLAQNHEWTWQLNRHEDWVALSRAYRDTWDEKYAAEFVQQMLGWAESCPVPEDAANGARSAWRTIETGIRAAGAWTELWNRFLLSPAMTDDALLVFLRAYIDHANHLMAHHTTGNWLAMEANGLYHVGALFPEFKDAGRWRDTGAAWTYAEMENQVYPDGVQIELASGYHHVSLNNFLGIYKIAQLNGYQLPADFLARLERMYDFDVYGALPDRKLPGVQDGGYMDVRGALREASSLFPQRADFQWYATDGKEGRVPSLTSYAFPYAGYFFQRSGWEPDARVLMFDGGPFGYGHQHEDKLQIIVHAYGRLLLTDPGVYTYERSKWRTYFCDSPSHNVVLVDGQSQRRSGRPRDEYVVKQPLAHVWRSTDAFDYVQASYDEPFGGDVKLGVRHTRGVLFVKPNYWVMLDTLESQDGKPHTYEALFHFPDELSVDGLRCRTTNTDAANLTVLAALQPGLSLEKVQGGDEPLQGWLPVGISKVRPAPVGIYRWQAGGTSYLLTVLSPSPAGQTDALVGVLPDGNDGLGASIRWADGTEHRVRFAGREPGPLAIGAQQATGHVLWSDGQMSWSDGEVTP